MIALACAADIPARIASVYAPSVTPPDFHAVAEVFREGGWHLIDATRMAEAGEIAVIGVGRDIDDVAFVTAFGPLVMNAQSVVMGVSRVSLVDLRATDFLAEVNSECRLGAPIQFLVETRP